jgi:oligopeptide transport system permease protein
MPGGPFDAERNVPPEIKRELEAYYGLDKPVFNQYLDYLGRLVRGDLGPSYKYANRSVNEMIAVHVSRVAATRRSWRSVWHCCSASPPA